MFHPSVQFGTGLTSNVWHLTLNFDVCINLPLLHYTAFGRLWSVVIKMRTQLLLIPTPKSHNWSALSWHNRNFHGREKFILCWWFFEGFDIVYHRALSWPRCLALCLLSCSPLLTHSHFRYLFQTKNDKKIPIPRLGRMKNSVALDQRLCFRGFDFFSLYWTRQYFLSIFLSNLKM